MLKYLNKNIITFAEVLNKILSGFFYTIKGFLQAGLPPGPFYNDFKSLTSYTFISTRPAINISNAFTVWNTTQPATP